MMKKNQRNKINLPPVMSQTSMGSNLLQTLKILTKFVVQTVSKNLNLRQTIILFFSILEYARCSEYHILANS